MLRFIWVHETGYTETMNMSQFATKKDVEEIVGRVVGELLNEALQLISLRFKEVDKRFDQIDRRFEQIDARLDRMDKRLDRLEYKMDEIADKVDHHTVDIRTLQRKAA